MSWRIWRMSRLKSLPDEARGSVREGNAPLTVEALVGILRGYLPTSEVICPQFKRGTTYAIDDPRQTLTCSETYRPRRNFMETFLARWPNGDVSFVAAESEEDACRLLDEVGDPFNIQLFPLGDVSLAMHFRLMDTGELELEEMSETSSECFSKALPRVYAARGELYDANFEMNSDQWKERMRKAVEDERAREYPCNAEEASRKGLGYDKVVDEDENADG